MNNINKEYFFDTKEAYLEFKAHWAKYAQGAKDKEDVRYLLPVHHLIYNMIRDKPMENGFTPITKKTKLENGFEPDGALNRAIYQWEQVMRHGENSWYWNPTFAPFKGHIDPDKFTSFDPRHR